MLLGVIILQKKTLLCVITYFIICNGICEEYTESQSYPLIYGGEHEERAGSCH